jgi:aminoglycoside 2'-N-acetyltransferase I
MIDASQVTIRRLRTAELDDATVRDIRRLLAGAFAGHEDGDFTEEDWQHSIGGVHVLVELDGSIAGHVSVVERALEIDGRPVRTGYVEAVAIDPQRQRQGLGTIMMRDVNAYIADHFELGALGTGSHAFYERLGWQTWRGPTGVRAPDGLQPTPDEDGYILILRTPASPPLRLTDPISCDPRSGDSW